MPENDFQTASIFESSELVDRFDSKPDPLVDQVPGFTVSKYELYELMKHCYRTARDIQFDDILLDDSNRERQWRSHSAYCRFGAIAEVVGPEMEKRAVAEVEKQLRDENPYFWRAFLMKIPLRRNCRGMLLREEQQPPLWIVESEAE